jgi:hypothetical protein
MVRAVREETGLAVRPLRLASVDSIHREREDHAFQAIRIIYHAEIVGGTLANEADGTTDLCGWWSVEQARRLPLVDLAELGLQLAFSQECRAYPRRMGGRITEAGATMTDHETEVAAAMRCLDEFMAAFNARDLEAF